MIKQSSGQPRSSLRHEMMNGLLDYGLESRRAEISGRKILEIVRHPIRASCGHHGSRFLSPQYRRSGSILAASADRRSATGDLEIAEALGDAYVYKLTSRRQPDIRRGLFSGHEASLPRLKWAVLLQRNDPKLPV